MNALLLRNLGGMRRATSLQSFAEYRQAEAQNPQMSSVTSEGTLLEYETLELRIHPPNVVIDNEAYDDVTVVTIDSANRPGTLIEVVQCLTELGLSIRRARISSDGGWFVDEFFVSETPKGKLLDSRKLATIKKVLSVDAEASAREQQICTVFELAGRDRHGLLAAVLQLLVLNGCDVLSAAVWTFHDRVALVISAVERGQPLMDTVKLDRLEQILYDMLGGDDAVVNSELVRGDVHHERRLHHLLLLEELKSWEQQLGLPVGLPGSLSATPSFTSATGLPGVPPALAAESSTGAVGGAEAAAGADGAAPAVPFMRMSLAETVAAAVQLDDLPRPQLLTQTSFGATAAAAATAAPLTASTSPFCTTPSAAAAAASQDGTESPAQALRPNSSSAYTPAGFPCAEEGGAAITHAPPSTSGNWGSSSFFLEQQTSGGSMCAAPAGPTDLQDSMMSAAAAVEPLIDVGLAVPLDEQLDLALAATYHSQRLVSSTGGHLPTIPETGSAGPSPHGAVAGQDGTKSASSVGPSGDNTPTAASRPPSQRAMTVTGDSVNGQPLAPALTGALPRGASAGGAAGAAVGTSGAAAGPGGAPASGAGLVPSLGSSSGDQDQLAFLRKSEVRIQHSTLLNYWLVQIRSRDRNKLFFDTVCTLADMNYDIYHATIDSEGDAASQLFYVRPRYGECVWDERRAAKLRYMLESAVQRRFPRGLKVVVQSHDRAALVQLCSALSNSGFWITRADVRTLHSSAVLEFSITDTRGQMPDHTHVERICESVGGVTVQDVYGVPGTPANGGFGRKSAGKAPR